MARALIDVVGDSASAQRAIDQTSAAVAGLGDELKALSVDAKASTEAMVAASAQRVQRLQLEAAAAKELAGTYAFGSAEQVAAAQLYEQRITRLAKLQGTVGVSADEAARLQVSATMRQVAALDAEAAAYGRVAEASTGAAAKIASTNAAAAAAQRDRMLGVEPAAAAPSITRTAGTVGRGLTTYATLPAAVIGYEAVHQALDYSQALLLIRTQAGASEGELQRMDHDILELVSSGRSFGQTAQDMAQGLYYVESEGIRGGRALAIVHAAAAGAAKGQTDMASTTNALTSAMKVYDVAAEGAAKTMATIDAITATGKMHLEDLNAAFSTKFFTTAKQLGIPLEQAGAALDVFTKAGVPAEVAANNMTTSFIKMLTPAKSALPYLQQLGLDSDSLGRDLQEGGLSRALASLAAGYEHLVQTQGKVAANRAVLESFGGSRSGAPALALVQQYATYLKSVYQIQKLNNPATFWSQVSEAMHQPAMQIKQDVAEIGADFIKLGVSLAPEVASLSRGIATVATDFNRLPAPVKDAAGVIVLALAVGGPAGLAIKGVGTLVGGIGDAAQFMARQFGSSTAAIDADLATMRAELAATTTEVGALGTSFETLPAKAGPAIAATEAETAGLGATGLLGRLGPAALFAGGGLLAGQIAGGVIPGRAGSIIGSGLEGAGLGAAVGSIVPGIGTLLGAGVGAGLGGLVGAASSFIHEAPSLSQQLDDVAQSYAMLGHNVAAAAAAVTSAQSQLANDRVGRDQAQQAVRAAQAEEQATRGTREHAAAVDRLNAAQYNLRVVEQQLSAHTAELSQAQAAHTAELQKEQQAAKSLTDKLVLVAQQEKGLTSEGIDDWAAMGIRISSSDEKLASYVQRMTQLANSLQSSDPQMAKVMRNLVQIAEDVKAIPNAKTIRLTVEETIHRTYVAPRIGPGGDIFPSGGARGPGTLAGSYNPGSGAGGGGGHGGPTFSFTGQLPAALQEEQLNAQLAGQRHAKDAAVLARKAWEDIHAYLEQQLALAKTVKQRVSVKQQLVSLGDEHDYVQQITTAKAKAAAQKRSVEQDQLLQQARLDIANGEVAAARKLLLDDQARLKAKLAEATTSEQRLAIENQLTKVARLLHSKTSNFQLDPQLQMQIARADALAALDPGLAGPSSLQMRLAREAKSEAMKAIRSHELTLQGLTAAWQIVGQENSILAQAKGAIDTYHAVSTAAITKGLGLSHAVDMTIRERLAQQEAHRGYAPNNQGASGSAGNIGSLAGLGAIPVHIDVRLIGDLRKIISEVEAHQRASHNRAGGRR